MHLIGRWRSVLAYLRGASSPRPLFPSSSHHFLISFALLLLVPLSLGAQTPPPACTAPEFRQFDFWVGEWNVTDSAGTTPYGSNSITREEEGCLIHEHWSGTNAGTGQSFNFYNAARHDWTQVWVASSGGQLHLVGRSDGRAMVLEETSVGPDGKPVRQRITWTPEPDGRVRQLWERSTDGGKTWAVGFDGWYRRKA